MSTYKVRFYKGYREPEYSANGAEGTPGFDVTLYVSEDVYDQFTNEESEHGWCDNYMESVKKCTPSDGEHIFTDKFKFAVRVCCLMAQGLSDTNTDGFDPAPLMNIFFLL